MKISPSGLVRRAVTFHRNPRSVTVTICQVSGERSEKTAK